MNLPVLPGDYVYVKPFNIVGLVVSVDGEDALVTDDEACDPLRVNLNDLSAKFTPFKRSQG